VGDYPEYNPELVGSTAVIIETIDNGKHWNKVWEDQTVVFEGLKSICFEDTIGWAVGEQGTIVKYTPQTGWVKQASITDLPLNKVYSLENNVWIAGGYSNDQNFFVTFLKSTNSGQTWTQHQTNPYLINDIYFIDNNLGWAVGEDIANNGVILKSTNGGDNWEVMVGNLIGPLNSIFIKDNYGWAAGEYGLVLRTTDLGTTWINEKNKIYPAQFKLEQNYPNPFNPTTHFEFRIADFGFVCLKIYDILGKEVATLVNEEKTVGNYEVEFDAANLSSGVYFYRLTAGKFSAARKMLLIK
jgi:photosystem II stability/assembly factor-like uncharacterized protein